MNANDNELVKNTDTEITVNRWGRLRNAMTEGAESTIVKVMVKRIK